MNLETISKLIYAPKIHVDLRCETLSGKNELPLRGGDAPGRAELISQAFLAMLPAARNYIFELAMNDDYLLDDWSIGYGAFAECTHDALDKAGIEYKQLSEHSYSNVLSWRDVSWLNENLLALLGCDEKHGAWRLGSDWNALRRLAGMKNEVAAQTIEDLLTERGFQFASKH